MASYNVFIKPSAAKELEAISGIADRRRVARRIRNLADEPRPLGSEKLSGKDQFRVRQGDYRIVYEIDDARSAITIVKVGHRKDIYR